MNQNFTPWVFVKMLVAGLVGRSWREKGDEFPLELERAKKLKEKKVLTFNKHDVRDDEPFPEGPRPKARKREKKTTDDDSGDESGGGENTESNISEDNEHLSDLGISQKIVDLLNEAGYTHVLQLKAAIEGGFDVSSISGIGDKTAESLKAQIGIVPTE